MTTRFPLPNFNDDERRYVVRFGLDPDERENLRVSLALFFEENGEVGSGWALTAGYQPDGQYRYFVEVEPTPGSVFAWAGMVSTGVVNDPEEAAEQALNDWLEALAQE